MHADFPCTRVSSPLRWGPPLIDDRQDGALCFGNFDWYCMEVAFPPLPLLSNYEDLCPGFDLDVAEGYAQDCDLPETP